MKKTILAFLFVSCAIFPYLGSSATGVEECGRPTLDFNADRGIYLWKTCNTGVWSVRILHGGAQNPPRSIYDISVTSNTPFLSIEQVSLEGEDNVTVNVNPAKIDFDGASGPSFQDGIDFTPATESSSCLIIKGSSDIKNINLGRNAIAKGNSLDLDTLRPCAKLNPAIFSILLDDTDD